MKYSDIYIYIYIYICLVISHTICTNEYSILLNSKHKIEAILVMVWVVYGLHTAKITDTALLEAA